MSANLGYLINRIAKVKKSLEGDTAKTLSEQTLDHKGLRGVKEGAFVKIAAKVERYVDLSLALRATSMFEGLPPTELKQEDGHFVPQEFGNGSGAYRTTAIDQQRELYAAAQVIMLDPPYGESIASDLVEWHDAFVRNFVVGGENPRVRASLISGRSGRLDPQEPDPMANLRLTYAVQGSATLARAFNWIAELSSDSDKSRTYRSKADELKKLALAIGEQFHRDYADRHRPGRYFLYPCGRHRIPALRGLSHNNSQSYLIEGMRALAALHPALWQKRLEELLSFIGTQRDPVSGLLHEFSFKPFEDDFPSDAINQVEELGWQSREGNETVILGHTIAGLYAGPGKLIADSSDPGKLQKMTFLVEDFVEVINRLGGIHENGLLANGFELISDGNTPFRNVAEWPEGAWQAELLWQFLLHADRCGVDLAKFDVRLEAGPLTLDRLLARSLAFHDAYLFNGPSYVVENGKPLAGRVPAAPINHATDTLRELADNLSAH